MFNNRQSKCLQPTDRYWKKWCEMHVKYMWNFHLVFHIQFHTSVKNNVKSPCENHVKWCPPFHIIKCCEKDMWNCEMCVKLCEMCAVKSCTIDHVNLTCEIYKNIHRKLWKKVCETFNIFKNQENVTYSCMFAPAGMSSDSCKA